MKLKLNKSSPPSLMMKWRRIHLWWNREWYIKFNIIMLDPMSFSPYISHESCMRFWYFASYIPMNHWLYHSNSSPSYSTIANPGQWHHTWDPLAICYKATGWCPPVTSCLESTRIFYSISTINDRIQPLKKQPSSLGRAILYGTYIDGSRSSMTSLLSWLKLARE